MQQENVPLVSELAGRTTAYEMSEVRPQVTGVIKARLFEEGAIVRAGQTLYQIDPSLYQAAAAEARASVASAEATRVAAQERAQRFKPLAEMEAVSKQDYSDAVAAERQAAAAVALAKARLDTAQINLRFTRVPAPISGRIGRSLVTTGALVTASQSEPLALIQRLDPIFVDIQQSSKDLLELRRALAAGGISPSSTQVTLTLEDGSTYPYPGRLEFAEAVVDPETGSVTVRARFPNPDGLLLPGMYVRAQVTQAEAQSAILVPQQAVSREQDGSATVIIIDENEKVVRKPIVTSRVVGDKWLVASGLSGGERVVVEGLNRIRPGDSVKPVRITRPAASSTPAAGGNAPAPARP